MKAGSGAPATKVRRIFVSYRRSDTGGHVGLLVKHLREKLGSRAVFCDVDEIQPGDVFNDTIAHEIARCAVIFVVIGPDWLTATGEDGTTPRIRQSGDVVRKEVVSALASGGKVIPLLVGGAKLPPQEQLPSDLVPLLQHNMKAFSHSSGREWEKEVAELVRDDIREPWRPASPLRGRLEVLSAVQSALYVATVAMAAATLLRGIAPMYLLVESTLMSIVGVLGAATGLVVWNSWHPGPRHAREFSPRFSLLLLMALPLLWSGYRYFRPLVLTAAAWQNASIDCSDDYLVQPYRGSQALWQPTTDDKDGDACNREFTGQFQLVTLRSGLARWGKITLQVEVANGLGRILAVLAPKANRPDLSEDDSLPPAKERVSLPYRGGGVYMFRLESSLESVQALVTLDSPFGWLAGRESLDVTLSPRNPDSPR